MSTPRVTRSGSRARSNEVASNAGSARRSRRGGTPNPTADEDDTVVNKRTRNYGIDAQSNLAEQMAASAGLNDTVNPIASAVNTAAPAPPQAQASSNRLAVVNEEVEIGGVANEEQEADHDVARVGEAASSFFSRFSHWAPHDASVNGPPVDPNAPLGRDSARQNSQPQTYWAAFLNQLPSFLQVLHCLGYLGILFALYICYVYYYRPNFTPKYDLFRSNDYTDSSYSYVHLKHRVDSIEQTLKDLTQVSISGSDAPIITPKRQINWFTPGFGTSIDPLLSSPTAATPDPQAPWTSKVWSMITGAGAPLTPICEGPEEALRKWDDPIYDRWCAPSTRGKLQLTVILERAIAPTELIVENIAKDATPISTSAPREVELWIEILDEDVRASVSDAIGRTTDLWESSSPQAQKELDPKVSLGENWVPVGRWTYNIWNQQEVQTFGVDVPLLEYGVRTEKVAVRVNSNWGDIGYTCVNRLRLHGHDTSGIKQWLEHDPALVE